jgi:hypothetical protein
MIVYRLSIAACETAEGLEGGQVVRWIKLGKPEGTNTRQAGTGKVGSKPRTGVTSLSAWSEMS